jgi:hypothetical protein
MQVTNFFRQVQLLLCRHLVRWAQHPHRIRLDASARSTLPVPRAAPWRLRILGHKIRVSRAGEQPGGKRNPFGSWIGDRADHLVDR